MDAYKEGLSSVLWGCNALHVTQAYFTQVIYRQ